MLTDLKTLAVAVSAALVIGFSAGYMTKGKFVKADQLDSVVEAHEQTAHAVQQSLEQSSAIERKVTESTSKVTAIRKMIAAAPQLPETSNEANLRPSCPGTDLDIGTVQLLNAARAGTDPGSTSFGHAEGKASSGLTLPQLLDNDLEIVGLYHELTERHDALVDYVQSLINAQDGK